MKTKVVRIGNSLGIRIPKALLEQTGLKGAVEIEAKGRTLVVRPHATPRTGWSEAFRAMAQRGDDGLLDEPAPTKWDADEWRW
ncbi:MAG: AbrB/MazE/SpoVT family DNA-binding domain-containing protein [Planctomycetota bacterium]